MTTLNCKLMTLPALAATAGLVSWVNTAIAQDLDSSKAHLQILSSVGIRSYQTLTDRDMSGIVGTDASTNVYTSINNSPLQVSITSEASANGPNAVTSAEATTSVTTNGRAGGAAGGGIAGAIYHGPGGWGGSVDWKAVWVQLGQ